MITPQNSSTIPNINKERFFSYLETHNITDIIFDFDETLCTLEIDWYAWGDELNPFIKQHVKNFTTAWSHTELNKAIQEAGEQFKEELTARNIQLERKYYNGYTRDEEALKLLQEVAEKGYQLHLWTTNCKETVEPILQEVGIDKLFTNIAYFNNVQFIKPDPYGFTVLNPNNLPKEQFVFVGDSSSDKGVCDALNIPFFHINNVKR